MVGNPGVFLDYTTPVLGKPWRIPLEVPFYQWTVARWRDLTGMGLDQSGKLVSIGFLFACLWPIWKLLQALSLPAASRFLALAAFLSVPLHLYWGRSFLIETTGLFLSLSMVACVVAGFRGRDWRWLVAGLVFGILAALCKVTTWAVACGVAGLLILFSNGIPQRKDLLWMGGAALAAVLPLIPAKLWLNHGDKVKAENPFAREIITATSAKQSAWNFGTWDQKTNPEVWMHIGRHITDQLLVPVPILGHWILPLILVAGAAASPRRIPLILIFLAGFAAGPLIFTNLYFEHNYYWVANGVWLLLALGVALAGIAECDPKSRWPVPVAVSLGVVVCTAGFAAWHQKFLPILQNLPTREALAQAWITPVQQAVPPNRTILILGNDWNPNALYYAERKGIGYPTVAGVPFPSPIFDESLKLFNEQDCLGAVVISEALFTGQNRDLFLEWLDKLGMSKSEIRTGFGLMFPALDLTQSEKPTTN